MLNACKHNLALIKRPEEKQKSLERKIMKLVEESCIASKDGDVRAALEKAKLAASKEKSLVRFREQSGLSDANNVELTFAVRDETKLFTFSTGEFPC